MKTKLQIKIQYNVFQLGGCINVYKAEKLIITKSFTDEFAKHEILNAIDNIVNPKLKLRLIA